jgi:hypothetical protein
MAACAAARTAGYESWRAGLSQGDGPLDGEPSERGSGGGPHVRGDVGERGAQAVRGVRDGDLAQGSGGAGVFEQAQGVPGVA